MTVKENSRDQSGLNEEVNLSCKDVIAEPDSSRSPDFSWKLNNQCFSWSRKISYVGLTVVLGPLFSLILGLMFGIITFIYIWWLMPVYGILTIIFGFLKRLVTLLLQTVVVPWSFGCGHLFSSIRIKYQKLADNEEKDKVLTV